MLLRKIAFIIGILGLGLLISFLLKSPVKINNFDSVIVGQIVEIEGFVEEQRNFGNGELLIVDDLEVYCECNGKYAGLNVKIEGMIEKFPDDYRLRVFRIEVLD